MECNSDEGHYDISGNFINIYSKYDCKDDCDCDCKDKCNCKGDRGDRGPRGDMGSKGERGDCGPRGDRGCCGAQGDIGPQGAQGAQGPQGAQGAQGPQGAQGEQGDTGAQGAQGDMGPQGAQGDMGPQGPQGDMGPQGPQGDTGAQGAQGDTGAQGDMGPQGAQGDMGPQGAQGPQGDMGPQGPPGENVSPIFIHCTKITEQLMVAEDNVIFDIHYAKKGDCDLSSTLPTSDLLVWSTGYYHLYFNVYHIQPCQFSIFKNNVIVDGGIVGSPTGSSQNSVTVIIQINPEDILYYPTPLSLSTGLACLLQFRNHTSFADTVLLNGQSGSGSATPQITAVVVLHKLSEL